MNEVVMIKNVGISRPIIIDIENYHPHKEKVRVKDLIFNNDIEVATSNLTQLRKFTQLDIDNIDNYEKYFKNYEIQDILSYKSNFDRIKNSASIEKFFKLKKDINYRDSHPEYRYWSLYQEKYNKFIIYEAKLCLESGGEIGYRIRPVTLSSCLYLDNFKGSIDVTPGFFYLLDLVGSDYSTIDESLIL